MWLHDILSRSFSRTVADIASAQGTRIFLAVQWKRCCDAFSCGLVSTLVAEPYVTIRAKKEQVFYLLASILETAYGILLSTYYVRDGNEAVPGRTPACDMGGACESV